MAGRNAGCIRVRDQRALLHHSQQKLIDVKEPVIRCRDAASPLANDWLLWSGNSRHFSKRTSSDWRNFYKRSAIGKSRGMRSSLPQNVVRRRGSRLPDETYAGSRFVCPTRQTGRCGIRVTTNLVYAFLGQILPPLKIRALKSCASGTSKTDRAPGSADKASPRPGEKCFCRTSRSGYSP